MRGMVRMSEQLAWGGIAAIGAIAIARILLGALAHYGPAPVASLARAYDAYGGLNPLP